MKSEGKRTSSADSRGTTTVYCHPLRLQSMSPKKFMETVSKILNGSIKLLVRHY